MKQHSKRSNNVLKTTSYGFQQLNTELNNGGLIQGKASKNITDAFMKHTIDDGPYIFMITLTFKHRIGSYELIDDINRFIHYYNCKYFGGKYFRQNKYVKGYAFIEEHKRGASNNPLHVHILIKHHQKHDKFVFNQHRDIFHKAVAKVRGRNNNQIFNEDCVNITEVRDNGAICYCFKQIWDRNLDNVKIITKGGISDCC